MFLPSDEIIVGRLLVYRNPLLEASKKYRQAFPAVL
jgi:hypothetical protein